MPAQDSRTERDRNELWRAAERDFRSLFNNIARLNDVAAIAHGDDFGVEVQITDAQKGHARPGAGDIVLGYIRAKRHDGTKTMPFEIQGNRIWMKDHAFRMVPYWSDETEDLTDAIERVLAAFFKQGHGDGHAR